MGFDYDALVDELEQKKNDDIDAISRAESDSRHDIADIHRRSLEGTDESIDTCIRIRDSQK